MLYEVITIFLQAVYAREEKSKYLLCFDLFRQASNTVQYVKYLCGVVQDSFQFSSNSERRTVFETGNYDG